MAGRSSFPAKICRYVLKQQALPEARPCFGPASAAIKILGPPSFTGGCGPSSPGDGCASVDDLRDGRWERGERRGAFFGRNVTGNSAARSIVGLEDEFRTGLRLGRATLSPVVTNSAQCVPYSSLALETADEGARQASEIGYEVVGHYRHEVDGINSRAVFAVVQVGSHQFKVSPGDMIYTEKLKCADINEKLLLNRVLLMGSVEETIIGRPNIPGARITAVVEEIALDEKVIVFKKKRRKNYRRTNGHRQELTRLRILNIENIDSGTSWIR